MNAVTAPNVTARPDESCGGKRRGISSEGGTERFPVLPSVLDLVELCPRCTRPGRAEVHLGTVCPVSGIEHSSRGASRDYPVRCICGRRTRNWSARCGCQVSRLWETA